MAGEAKMRLGRSPGEGNGNPLQCCCLENPMDRGAWQATVHEVTKSWTRLSMHAHTVTLVVMLIELLFCVTGRWLMTGEGGRKEGNRGKSKAAFRIIKVKQK